MILPTMEEALQHILTDIGEEDATYIGITEQLSTGYGEKIFHVYDYRTKNDIARFHVRRDNRPLEGYWFNFHYHLYDDNFEKHYEIGEIYWDKNIPPKWMSSSRKREKARSSADLIFSHSFAYLSRNT